MAEVTKSDHAISVIEKLVTTIAEKEGFKKFKLDIIAISTQGANYLGDLYLVDVVEPGKDTLKLFAKATNIPEKARDIIDANNIYKREVFMYSTIADTFHKLQDKHNIPEHKQFKFPKYFGSHLGHCEEVIILENLAARGFVLHDRLKPLNLEYTKAGIEEIAKFHALSFALEKEDPELFNKLIKYNNDFQSGDFDKMAEMTRKFIPINIGFIDSEHKNKVEEYFKIHLNGVFKEHTAPVSKNSVLVHGDYKMSNIMVKYRENIVSSLISKYSALSSEQHAHGSYVLNEETPVAALKPVDYQTVFYGCPLTDVVYFLFSGTDAEFRRLHFERILEHYHVSLAEHLRLMSYDINDIYPKSTFYFELKDKMMYGLEVALLVLSSVLAEYNEDMKIAELVNIDVSQMLDIPVNKLYVERLNGIVRDYVRWGLLK